MATGTNEAKDRNEVLWNLAGLVVIVALLAIGAAYGVDALSRAQRTENTLSTADAALPVNVSGVPLTVPASWLKSEAQANTDFADRLDLVVPLQIGQPHPLMLELALVPKARARASASLLDSVYLKHFSPEEAHGVVGLVGKPLTGGDGYDGETVWYDPISQHPFVAKCAAPLAGETSGACIRTVLLNSGLSAILTFDEALLQSWRALDAPLAVVLSQLGAGTIER